MTTVSIIIPTYNGTAYLRESIASIRRQTFTDVEIIVVDDASTDGGLDAVQADPMFADVRFIRHAENRGPGESRRTGVRAARGAYVSFLDADDLFEPEFLASGLAVLERDSTIGLFCCDGLLVDADGAVLHDGGTFNGINAAIKRYPLRTGRRSVEDIFTFGTVGIGFLVRRAVFERVAYPPGRRLEDLEFQLDVAASGFGVFYLHEPLARYRMHPSNSSGTSAGAGMTEALVACLMAARTRHRPLQLMGRRARRRIADVRMDLGVVYIKSGAWLRGCVALCRAVAEYPPQAIALVELICRRLPSRLSRPRAVAN